MFEVMKHPCQNCLYTEDRIVSPERAEGIIRQCNEKSGHFICHVASIRGQDICCHNFYKNMENKKVRLAKAWGLTRFVDMRKFDSRKKSWKELEGDKPRWNSVKQTLQVRLGLD